VFVPVERNPKLSYYNMLINKGVIYRFAFDYTDRHRTELNRFKSFGAYDKGFVVTDAMMNELKSYATKSGIKPEATAQKDSDERIRIMFKAYVGRNVLDNAGFYPYLNSADPAFLAAKEYLEKH
jgi:carboxyl-terminal processing protease